MLGPVEKLALRDDPEIDREAVHRYGLKQFVELAWPSVESVPFIGGWHLDEICAHAEAVSRGQIKKLLINVPPGMTKSLTISVLWPIWDWITRPDRKWMFSTFDADLARRDALRARGLIRSDWFQARWPEVQVDESDDRQRTMAVYYTTKGGMRFSSSIGGRATGWHANIQVVDDPTKPSDIQAGGETARNALDATWNWYQNTMASRKADPKDFARVVIMQRLHEDDLAGRCLRDVGWEHLMLPMHFDPNRKCKTMVGGDRRTVEGELLCPARFDAISVAETERDMGPSTASAQLEQAPAPASGTIFERDWLLKEYSVLPSRLILVQSWDCAFKGLDTSDFVVGTLWGYRPGEFYLIDLVRDRMGFPETCAAIESMSAAYPNCIAKLIEDKANGSAVEQEMRKRIPGIIAVNPEGGKPARANACAGLFQAGNVYVPSPVKAPWIHAWREEMAQFPKGRHDDQVDSTTQALIYMNAQSYGRPDLIQTEGQSRYSRSEGIL